ncbi:MAG: ABC transporter permease, partial [Acidimicrobiia bacterium]
MAGAKSRSRSASIQIRQPPSAWSRVKRNKAAVFGLMVIGLVCTAALLAPWIAPYDPA